MSFRRVVIGLTERVYIKGGNGHSRRVMARIDTGATKSSIDRKLAEELSLGPVIKSKVFRSAHGKKVRPIVPVQIIFCGQTMKVHFSVIDREHMRHRVLIGINVLKKGFLIDASKK